MHILVLQPNPMARPAGYATEHDGWTVRQADGPGPRGRRLGRPNGSRLKREAHDDQDLERAAGRAAKEQVADIATLLWVAFWGNIVWQLFQFLAGFAEAGRTIRAGGETMVQGGVDLGDSLAGLPLVGSQLHDIARDAFAGAGRPLSDFGTQLEQFIFVVAAVLALLLALVTLVPWLTRYLPWRWARLRRLRAAHRAIRTAPDIADADIERALAMRAVTRLDYSTLLEYTPDPLGDWVGGRHDRLARAELASVGLRA